MTRLCVFLAGFLLIAAPSAAPQAVAPAKAPDLKNPLLPSGPDPWVVSRGGYLYFMSTTGKNLTIRRTRNMADLRMGETRVVWTPPATGPYSHDVWAPELHYLNGKWYIYFAADAGTNETHRIFALEGCAGDPLDCDWTMKGKVADPSDKWAIDASVFEDNSHLYLVWAGWEGDSDGAENIYIAALQNPWTVAGKRVRISKPQFKWEKVGDRPNQIPPHVDVNEAPEVLMHNGKIFLTYSASGCWTDSYALGMLTAKAGSDLLKPASWTKSPQPVFSGSADAKVYAPGHNSFFQSSDGKDWLIYHANSGPNQGCGDARSPRAQPFTWKADGAPDFGRPVSVEKPLTRPPTN